MKAIRSGVRASVFTPLFFILSLVAMMHAVQVSASPGQNSGPFAAILASKLAYYWYFVLLAFIIEGHSRRYTLSRSTAVRWAFVHVCTLICSFLIHEALSVEIDAVLLNTRHPEALLPLLFNNPAVWIESFAYAIILLGFSLVEVQRITRESELTCSLLEARLTKTTLQELRNHIQPTFIINTLQSILVMVREGRNKDANRVLSLLSEFLRATVYDNERDEIPLEEELRFLGQLIEIEQVRSRRGFTARREIARDVYKAVVPNFIFQPIVEELALRISAEVHTESSLVIRAARDGRMLKIEIEKISYGAKANAQDDLVLDISSTRLQQMYGSDHTLSADRSEGSIRVVISIPYREEVTESEGIFIGESVS
jgi:hypothetical protein